MNKKINYKEKLSILDTFVISTVLTIVGIRVFLELTGYPHIGNDTLHISHMLWGGLAMVATILILLLVENPNKVLLSVLGGVGFGFFIDEIGKFVTSDNNYFFRATAFLIYFTILAIWLISRVLIVRKGGGMFLSPAEWPEQRGFRVVIILWALTNIVGSIVAVGLSAFRDIDLLGFTNDLSDIIPTIALAVTLMYIIGLVQYKKGSLNEAARTIRTGALISTVAIYPYIFFDEQFSAIVGCLVTVAVIIALSETSIKELLKPILATLKSLT